MPKIREKQAQEILERHGYKILDYLGSGAASQVFKASRKSKGGGEKIIAAKVCCPTEGSWASLEDELRAAKELKDMKDKFKANLATAQRNGQTALVKIYEKNLKYLFKYLTVPKLKLQVSKEMMENGEEYEIAIFEAPLADFTLGEYIVGGYDLGKVTVTVMPDSDNPEYNMRVVSGVDVDYKALKKVIKSILKGLKVIHEEGKCHGDVKFGNILKKFNVGKGKYEYSITDFGTLKSGGSLNDFKNASMVLLCQWLVCVGMDSAYVQRTVFVSKPDYYFSDTFEKDGVTGVAIPKGTPMPDKHSWDVYFPTQEDMELVNFCKKLYRGEFISANLALADPWLARK